MMKILGGYEPFAGGGAYGQSGPEETGAHNACKGGTKEKTLGLNMAEGKNKKRVVADSPGFEPGTEAPEASVLSRLYYESS